ncbi:hypothetical protein IQ238_17600 [Pleurocapsales cyanobacterium LEGE 06147]|nr:hypothetical protein [Pleurocapsales cyanobacterium LEGE 06147]
MSYRNSPLNNTSSDLEKAALNRYRSLVPSLPESCRVFRETWNSSTVLCLDFTDCPDSLVATMEQFLPLMIASHHLGLADSLLFKLNNKIMGWATVTPK